jgi:hypothetical protein
VNEHIKSASSGEKDLTAVREESFVDVISDDTRLVLSQAAQMRRSGWFKSVTWMEAVANDIVGSDLSDADPGFADRVDGIFEWATGAA